ncbi:MAG: hypothetical protein ACM3X0_07585 [Bacteroidota bacterium]
MSIPWLTVLQNVPWSDVLSNAPKVADGAKKLWNTIGRKSATPAPVPPDDAALAPEDRPLAALQGKLAEQQAALADLHEQMLASSELIKALAEQNAGLIARSEIIQRRLRWMLAGLTASGLLAATALFLVLSR